MDTKKIREFAIEQHKLNSDKEHMWVKYSDDWDIQIFLPEWDLKVAECSVYLIVDGSRDWDPNPTYEFNIPRA